MILLLDVGNSATKWRCGSGRGRSPEGPEAALHQIDQTPTAVWVASVADDEHQAALADAIRERWQVQAWFARASTTACGVRNSYPDPQRMGVDRWLAMIAAYRLVGGAVCVIDAGSALTIDFLDADGRHRGGYILPGMAMMERSLLGETARVRFGDAPRDEIAPGTSTEAAVFNGLQLAQVGAIATALDRFGAGDALVFTGGNGAVARALLDRGGEFIEDLVLDGLESLGVEVSQA